MSSFGDLIRAMRALEPDDEETRLIASMLGVQLGVGAAAEVKPVEIDEPPQPLIIGGQRKGQDSPYVAFEAKRVLTANAETPEWLVNVAPLAPERLAYRKATLPFDPLIAQNKARAMISTLVSTEVEEGPMDVPRLISAIARNEPLRRLYRRRSRTVRHGVQLLVDRSESMTLFSRDVKQLVREIQNVIGETRVELRLFAHCPSRGAGAPGQKPLPAYTAPAAGTPILMLTDLGIGAEPIARATQGEWDRFFAATNAAACPVYALVPYPSSRWPETLAAQIACVLWDPATTVQHARRATTVRRRKVS
jgi:hypothetical protein